MVCHRRRRYFDFLSPRCCHSIRAAAGNHPFAVITDEFWPTVNQCVEIPLIPERSSMVQRRTHNDLNLQWRRAFVNFN